jgi:hypothetical protein
MQFITPLSVAIALSAFTPISPAQPQCPPSTPGGLTASDGTSCAGVSLNWNEMNDETWYEVWRNNTNNWNTAVLIATPNGSSYFDATALPGVTHHYWVTSWRAACLPGDNRSGHGNHTTGYRGGAPNTPTNIVAYHTPDTNGLCDQNIHVSWTGDSRALFYTIRANGFDDYSSAHIISQETTSPVDLQDPVPSASHYIWVTATGACGVSDPGWGNIVDAPNPVRNVVATDGACTGVTVSWSPPSPGGAAVQGYNVTRNNGYLGWTAASPFIDTEATPGVTSTYGVTSLGSCTSSAEVTDNGSRGTQVGSITHQPQDATVCADTPASMSVAMGGPGPYTYQWRVEDSNGGLYPLSTTPTSVGCGSNATATSATGPTTQILVTPGFCGDRAYGVRCVVTSSSCGHISSNLATLLVRAPNNLACGGACDPDFNHDGDLGTDADIEAFFACLGGNCCATCGSADFNADGDIGTDADIESFFRVLAGGAC